MPESIKRWWHAACAALARWRERISQRDELSRMSEAELRDAGINRYEAWFEIRKPFWRA